VDVRPILRAGGEPFSVIMQAVEGLKPGQGMRLFATFKPIPLFGVLGSRGFSHEAIELDGGEWEVLFRPDAALSLPSINPGSADASAWPEPSIDLDNRDLDPPEPMARILEAIERMKAGEVLSALLLREPRFLFPELAKRGHQWRGDFDAGRTTYKISIRVGSAIEARG
ncbi:MAG: universal stress protein, partial [Bradyrhizobium sp.]|nr:universal stress protein [Bradyrhizobium sp.]